MAVFIRAKLDSSRTQCLPAAIDDDYLVTIASIIAEKADGVFLWVHYALSSLIRGMRNEDNFAVLLDRIEELPNGMHQLYRQMWKRLNGDQQHYQEEATRFFSYVATWVTLDDELRTGAVSLFEMLIALNTPLQDSFLTDLKPQDPVSLARQCEALKAQLLTRSAGLLELSMDAVSHNVSSVLTISSRSTEIVDDTEDVPRSPSVKSQRSLCDLTSPYEDKLVTTRRSQGEISHRTLTPQGNKTLGIQYRTRVRYLHRTARDFLLNTQEGQEIVGRPKELPAARSRNLVRARMSALMQGLVRFNRTEVENLMKLIGSHCLCIEHSQPEKGTELVVTLRRVCQTLSIPGVPEHHAGYGAFWEEKYGCFEARAAFWGFPEYIQNYIQDRATLIDPPCRGWLIRDTFGESPSRWLQSLG
ncbi:MAG: hypothetical protein Q9177_003164 [Variospora cf. flavescens]